MAFVGKKFPNLSVSAMNEMGDTFRINILEEAQKATKKYYYSGIQRILHLYVQQNYTHFKMHLQILKKETLWLLVPLVILQKFILLG